MKFWLSNKFALKNIFLHKIDDYNGLGGGNRKRLAYIYIPVEKDSYVTNTTSATLTLIALNVMTENGKPQLHVKSLLFNRWLHNLYIHI